MLADYTEASRENYGADYDKHDGGDEDDDGREDREVVEDGLEIRL